MTYAHTAIEARDAIAVWTQPTNSTPTAREAISYAQHLLADQCPDAIICGSLRVGEGLREVLFRVPSWGGEYRGRLLCWFEGSSIYGEW